MRGRFNAIAIGLAVLAGVAPRAQTPPAQGPGIYLHLADETGEHVVPLHGLMVTEIKQKGTLKMVMTQGFAKGSIEGSIRGSAADVRVKSGDVTLQLILADPAASANKGFPDDPTRMFSGDYMPPSAKSAEEFVLLRLTPTKDNTRETQLGTTGRGGTSNKSKDAVELASAMSGPRAYIVHPKAPLPPGEYGLTWAPNGTAGQMWDFGVDPK